MQRSNGVISAMAKKINIKDYSSESYGLWYQPEYHRYASETLDVSGLRDFKGSVKIIMHKNKFKRRDDNRPSYTFRIAGCNSEAAKGIELDEDCARIDSRTWIPVDEAVRIARELAYMIENGYDAFNVYTENDFLDRCESATNIRILDD